MGLIKPWWFMHIYAIWWAGKCHIRLASVMATFYSSLPTTSPNFKGVKLVVTHH